MKEREPNELTNQPNSFNLDSNMDGPNATPEVPQPERHEEPATQEQILSAQDAENIAIGLGISRESMGDVFKQAARNSGRVDKRDLESGHVLPESFEDLVKVVMRSATEDFKTGGERELIDKEGEIVKENFMAWIRQRMFDLHDFNPTSKVNFFSDINVKIGYSQISFYDMIFTGSYFLQERKEPDGRYSYHKNEDYEAIKQQLIIEAFMFSKSRNDDVEYKAVMGQEKELPKLLAQIYYGNPFTRSDFLHNILTMSSMDKKEVQALRVKAGDVNAAQFEQEKIKTVLKENTSVGDGVRKALLAYYYANDIAMLEKVLGPDSVLFQEQYDEYDSATGKIKGKKLGQVNEERKIKEKDKLEKDKTYIKYENGRLAMDTKKTFVDYMNVFNHASKDEGIVNEVRERIRQSIMQSGLSYSEAKYAEAWAFSMTRWTGIGARNDVTAAAFDAWSKPQNLLEYRLKQLAEKRRGVMGNIFNLAGIKRAGLGFFEGVTDTQGRTVLEAIQGGQGEDLKDDNPFKNIKDEEKIRFGQDAGYRFATNHVFNAFAIYDNIITHTDFNIEDMVTYDGFGRAIIDQEKANKMVDGIQKAIRYAYCTYAGTDYSKNIRVWDNGGVKELPVIAAMFGPDILKLIQRDIEKKSPGASKNPNVWEVGKDDDKFEMDVSKLKETPIREMLWKNVLHYLVAEELHSHRSMKSELKRYNYANTEKIYQFLKVKGLVSDEEEVEEMRKLSNSTLRVLAAEDFGTDVGKGLLKGFWAAMRIMLKDVATGK